jgi:acetyl esterase/lipase
MKYKTTVLPIVWVIICCLMAGCSNPNQDTPEHSFWTIEHVPYGTDANQTFDIKLPEGKKDVHAIVYIHGGFYYSGSKIWYPLFLTDYADNNIFATIDYRLIGTIRNNIHMDDMLADVDSALKRIQELAGNNGYHIIDVLLVGHSAGAHIGLLYGYKYIQEHDNAGMPIAACISLSGPTDYTDDTGWSSMAHYGETYEDRLWTLSWLGTELTGHGIALTRPDWTQQDNWPEYAAYAREISPIAYVSGAGNIPPTLLVHGPGDAIVPYSNSARLHAALDTASIPHRLITVTAVSGNNHMLGGTPNSSESPIAYHDQPWVSEAKEWMETYLR